MCALWSNSQKLREETFYFAHVFNLNPVDGVDRGLFGAEMNRRAHVCWSTFFAVARASGVSKALAVHELRG